jgi:hypothetical protein
VRKRGISRDGQIAQLRGHWAYTLLQVLSVTVFEKMPIQSAILPTPDRFDDDEDGNQLKPFTF